VGRINSLILRTSASRFTAVITGNAPVPVPITSRRQFQGIVSCIESGVCPKAARNFLDGFFLRLRTSPRSITTSCSYVIPSMRIEPKENFSKRMDASRLYYTYSNEHSRENGNDSAHQCSDLRGAGHGSFD